MPGQFPPPPGNEPPPSFFSPAQGGHFPLDINRVFGLTFSLYRYKWRTFVAIALLFMIPATLLLVASELTTGQAGSQFLLELQDVARGQIPELTSSVLVSLGISILLGAVLAIVTYVAEAGITKAAMETYAGGRPVATDSARFGLGRILALTGAYLVTFAASFAIIIFGSILATFALLATGSGGSIVPGPGVFFGLLIFVAAFAGLLFLTVRWSLVVPVVVIERAGALEALGRSWRLVSGSSWRVFGYLLAFALVIGVISFAIVFLATLVLTLATMSMRSAANAPALGAAITFVNGLVGAVLMAIPAIGMTLLYLDLRFRKGEEVPQPGGSPVPAPPPAGPPTF